MTVDGRAQERLPDFAGGLAAAPVDTETGPMPVSVALDLCDRLLGEIGRRQHRFAWLRPPGTGIDDCLVCDAYYPGHRLVAICHEDGSEPDALYAEQVPRNGLQLLVITPSKLGMDRLSAAEALVREIGALGPVPERQRGPEVIERPERAPAPHDRALARIGASFARASAPMPTRPPLPTRPSRPVSSRSPAKPRPRARPRPPVQRRQPDPGRLRVPPPRAARSTRPVASPRVSPVEREQRFGLLIGLALVIVLFAESLVLVVLLALGHDHPVLAFGFALDGCSRVLGTVAAARQGDRRHAWSCILIGSPGVLHYVLLGEEGAVDVEPGPLAGVVSALAIGVVALALVGALIGI